MTRDATDLPERLRKARAELARRHAQAPDGIDRYEARQARLTAVARRERDRRASGWCILRTSSRNTLPLAKSLADAGIEAWTPTDVRARRIVRGRRASSEQEVPIAPTFVFARANRLLDLAYILAQPISPHPAFSIFHQAGRVPLIAERDIAGLHAEEERGRRLRERAARAKQKPPTFEVGSDVKLEQPAFAGLSLPVTGQQGRQVFVQFGNFRLGWTLGKPFRIVYRPAQPDEGTTA